MSYHRNAIRDFPPYARSAADYDLLLSQSVLPYLARSFHHLMRLHRIRYRSAADVGCGTGRFAQYLTRWAGVVFGVDRSSAMVRLARRIHRGTPVRYLVQDLCALRLPHLVELITCNFDTLNYLLEGSELERALRRLYANLVAGGHLIFDMVVDTGERWRPTRQRLVVRTPGGSSYWVVSRHPRRRLRRVVILHPPRAGSISHHWAREIHVQRAYPRSTIARAVNRAGFALLGMHEAGNSLFPEAQGESRCFFVARKLFHGEHAGMGDVR